MLLQPFASKAVRLQCLYLQLLAQRQQPCLAFGLLRCFRLEGKEPVIQDVLAQMLARPLRLFPTICLPHGLPDRLKIPRVLRVLDMEYPFLWFS